jgi:hypothetical protein
MAGRIDIWTYIDVGRWVYENVVRTRCTVSSGSKTGVNGPCPLTERCGFKAACKVG